MKKRNLFDLQGSVAIVTGGGGLLASEHATALTDYGATVVLADINVEKCAAAAAALKEAGVTGVHARALDVTSRESWGRLLAETLADHGAVDILST